MKLIKIVPDNTNINFLKWKNVALLFSIITILGSVVLLATRGLNFGIDFEGGQTVRVAFQQPPNLDRLRDIVSKLQPGESVSVQEFGSNRNIAIRTALPEDQSEGAADRAAQQLQAAIQKEYPSATISSVETVSGKVSGELIETGAWSMLLAMLGISIYIWFRFEWQFGVGALFALFHDVLLTLGFFSLTQWEFDLNIIAALLTIIGYSLNDTIVIYDRIREDMRKYRKMDMTNLLNQSVNETLSRTVMTSLTMIAALTILLIFGPDVIFGFTAAMLLGIFVGTYSSIYMAAPLLIWLKVGPDSFVQTGKDDDDDKPKDKNHGAVV